MYVAFEGIDTSGKSTQIELLKSVFQTAIFTQEPYDKDIRKLALFGKYDDLTRAYLFLADRAKHAREVILPNKDKMIFSDRSLVSGIAYATEIEINRAIELNLEVCPAPDFVFMFKIDEKSLIERLKSKNMDSIESKGVLALLKIQDRMLETLNLLNISFEILDSNLDIKSLQSAIIARIETL